MHADFNEATQQRAADSAQRTRAHQNRLINEKSPYLLQHAGNPVDWYPWGEEAFQKARTEDKPIFLSIGYSTCHWCHVMERETFEDEEAARLMNESFVSIKVDREERPDIDHLYMSVAQMMVGGGGWPLNIIMTPDKKPFFAATYIPRESRFGRMGMLDLTARIREIWTTQRAEVLQSAEKITLALKQVPDNSPGELAGESEMDSAYEQLHQRYDGFHGGFGRAPKFPTPHNFLFLLRYGKRTGREKALEMVEKTLQAMRMGGIYDHVGFGFHRYSTDNDWLVPHFEKMLYDQALLAMAYIEAYQATGKPEYSNTAKEIFTYVLRDMTSPGGAFYSAEDADSEGEEGKFYVWKLQEIREALGDEDAELAARVFNVKAAGNFHEEATGRITGTNILHVKEPLSEIAAAVGISENELEARLERIRAKLLAAREARVRPHRDDKILTDWNGLMIAALATGARVLDCADYAQAAEKAANFVLNKMRSSDGRLLRRYRDGEAAVHALVDDYAFFIWGLLELYETTFSVAYLQAALDLNENFVTRFWDNAAGGFFFTPGDGEKLLTRKKEVYDGATPSGNSVAALNLLRIARITANPDPEQKAEAIGRAFAGNIKQLPSAYTHFLTAMEFAIGPSYEVVIAGDPEAEDTKTLLAHLRRAFLPNKVVVLRPAGDDWQQVEKIAEYTKDQAPQSGKATAYVCRNFNCDLPTTEPAKMLELLDGKNS